MESQSLFDFFDNLRSSSISNHFSGDFVGRVTPVPIPNTEVKPAGADGTARETAWESRKSPGLYRKPARAFSSRGLLLFGGCNTFNQRRPSRRIAAQRLNAEDTSVRAVRMPPYVKAA